MPVEYLYSPFIKGKSNDLRAAGCHLARVRNLMKPLVEILPLPEDATIESHINEFCRAIQEHLQLGELFVDFFGLLPTATMTDGQNAIIAGFNLLKGLGRPVTPAFGVWRDLAIWPLLKETVIQHGQGFCFRVSGDDLDDRAEDTWQEILSRSAELGLSTEFIDIALDFGDVELLDVTETVNIVVDFLALKSAQLSFRSIAVVGSSALRDVGTVPRDGVKAVFRKELDIWSRVLFDLPANQRLIFGDYGVIHPKFSGGGGARNMNAKIRYTAGDRIVIFRGHSRKGDGGQYHKLAEKVRDSKLYRGRELSAGDVYVDDCANHRDGPGGPGEWVFADMNHHLAYTALQVERITAQVGKEFDLATITALIAEV